MEDVSQQQQQQDDGTGNRIYLGNLLYSVKPGTIEEMLHEGGFGNFEKIHISVDPVSGRNPGYCFVDFSDKATADRALETLDVSIGGRPLKVRPCEPKKPRASTGGARWGREGDSPSRPSNNSGSGSNRDGGSGFNRWGDWNSNRDQRDGSGSGERRGQGPNAALNHYEENLQEDGRRLFVGGLGKMIDQDHNRAEMESIFAEYKPAAIGKRITARQDDTKTGNNRNFCFIDFETREDAEVARLALDGVELNGSPITVRTARRQREQLAGTRHEIQRNNGGSSSNNNTGDSPARAFASRDWRRRAD